MIKIIKNVIVINLQKIKFDIFIKIGIGIIRVISTSKIKKIIAIR